ncbi:NTF2-like protein [Lactarius tabidus]
MYRLFQSSVASVKSTPGLVIFIDEEQSGWCQQFSEEGYAVVQVARIRDTDIEQDRNKVAREILQVIRELGDSWAIITYGVAQEDAVFISNFLDATSSLKACIHFTISCESPADFIPRSSAGHVLPTIIHLSSSQEESHAAFQLLADSESSQLRSANEYPPITVYTYPRVPFDPPFPFRSKAPALVQAGESSTVNPYIRSATNLSYSRTLALLRRELGPHFDLEKLWERHTYYEFVERDASSEWSRLLSVKVPYVNHVATLTGGVGHDELARFYKYHFTGTNVTPPDTELIVVSRTVGADRIIDEMIFKATHTTEIDYFLPGIKPTGKPFQVALVGVIAFRGDKLTYWDQASLLVQLGLLDPSGLPVAGVETAQKVLDPFAIPTNTLMKRWRESEGLDIN